MLIVKCGERLLFSRFFANFARVRGIREQNRWIIDRPADACLFYRKEFFLLVPALSGAGIKAAFSISVLHIKLQAILVMNEKSSLTRLTLI